jgi:hypothetical protein
MTGYYLLFAVIVGRREKPQVNVTTTIYIEMKGRRGEANFFLYSVYARLSPSFVSSVKEKL